MGLSCFLENCVYDNKCFVESIKMLIMREELKVITQVINFLDIPFLFLGAKFFVS